MAQRVLILDDDPAIAALYAAVLRGAGLDVLVHTSFDAARAALKHGEPDALVTDVRVGVYNGLQLAILFRSMSPTGKIVVATGHDDPVIRQEADRLGAIFTTKPVDIQWLTSVLTA